MINKKLFLCILTILWICFIFSFSLHSGEKSAQLSDSVGESILEHSSSKYFDDVDEWSSLELECFHKVIRKCAHFAEFFILGILMRLTWQQTEMRYKRVVSVGLCFLVAVLDETIQLFIPGRAGLLTDVLLDGMGSIVGMCFCMIATCLFLRKRKKT